MKLEIKVNTVIEVEKWVSELNLGADQQTYAPYLETTAAPLNST